MADKVGGKGKGKRTTEAGPLARVGEALADFCERYFPDAFVFALCAVIIVFLGGLVLGEKPLKLVQVFGEGFWVLIPFTMQMALIIIGGFVVASSPPVARLIEWLAGVPKTPRGAVAFVALLAMLTSLLSWGLSLIFTGLLVREVVRRVPRIDYRAIGAAAYLGLGAVWALGLSSSAALLQNTKGSIPPALLHITGVIPLTQTIFLWQSLLTAAILIALSVAVAYFSCPSPEKAKTAEDMGITFEPLEVTADKPKTPADRLESSPVLSVVIAILMIAYIVYLFMQKGAMAATDLNTFNFIFLTAGILLHWRPGAFLKAVTKSVPATAGVIIQFPFYGGIFGLIAKTAINPFLAGLFVKLTSHGTYPILVGIYSAVLGVFVPSGGGKWVVEAPYIMAAANTLHVHLGWVVQIYNAAEALPNLINPFWMLPLMGILNCRARDLAGYSILQLLFHIPVVLFLCWLLAQTLTYLPPSGF
ncbi:MAG: TIGR00366 family protein [Desulfobaccales bacterium]